MATMGTVLSGLEDELRELLYTLEVDNYGQAEINTRFRSPKPTERATFRELTGKSRLFQISWSGIKQRTVGCTTRTFDVAGAITIGYPLHGSDIVRAADYQSICDIIAGTGTDGGGQSSTTGVSYRLVNYENEPEAEDVEDWLWYTIPLIAVIETS